MAKMAQILTNKIVREGESSSEFIMFIAQLLIDGKQPRSSWSFQLDDDMESNNLIESWHVLFALCSFLGLIEGSANQNNNKSSERIKKRREIWNAIRDGKEVFKNPYGVIIGIEGN